MDRKAEATTEAKVVATVQSAEFRARCAVALVELAQRKYKRGDAESGLATEVLRNPQRYVETVALLAASDPDVALAIAEANDDQRAFWPTPDMLRAVVRGAWSGLGGV